MSGRNLRGNKENIPSRPSTASSQASYVSASSTATTSSFSSFFQNIAKTVSNTSSTKLFLSNQTNAKKPVLSGLDPAREPIKSYLRFRPRPTDSTKAVIAPYVEILNETEVSLTAPEDPTNTASTYKFTRVFDDETTQADFFKQTTMPLVKDVLSGSSGLLFAYGVSNSGKTYTIQGGSNASDPGLLPRTLDVIFNSIEGMHSMCNFQPSRLTGVEAYSKSQPGSGLPSPSLPSPTLHSDPNTPRESLSTLNGGESIALSNMYEYAIWVSYAEIYNEKIYDLLEDSLPHSSLAFASPSSNTSLSAVGLGGSASSQMLRSAATLKRKALGLKQDKLANHKYVHGLKEIRVFSADEARSVLRKGQLSRRVYSTLLNRESSRSHGCFTIKIIRNLKDCDPTDPTAASVSRLNIVDLAGSERSSNTGSTGDRLKEAGNINKSLMVLGQCMEVLRRNQIEKEKGKKPALVPFRHSKLTELFQSFFAGEGKAAMIVNVNPYDTGFEENSHVMRFSAVAKDITTSRSVVPILTPVPKRIIVPQARMSDLGLDDTLDLTIEDDDSTLSDEEEEDEMVNYLFEENKSLRSQLVECKIRMSMQAEEIRSRLLDEFDVRMRELEQEADKRVSEVIEASENKMNLKIDLLTQAHTAALEALEEDEEEEAGASDQTTPQRLDSVSVEISSSKPVGTFPLIAPTPSGKHASITYVGSKEAAPESEEEVFAVPAPPLKQTPIATQARRSTRSSARSASVEIIAPPAKKAARPATKAAKSRKSPALALAAEGDGDESIIMVSQSKPAKKMKLRTKQTDIEVLQDELSFAV